jgi:ABC-type transport system substrate-binding protein
MKTGISKALAAIFVISAGLTATTPAQALEEFKWKPLTKAKFGDINTFHPKTPIADLERPNKVIFDAAYA